MVTSYVLHMGIILISSHNEVDRILSSGAGPDRQPDTRTVVRGRTRTCIHQFVPGANLESICDLFNR